MPDYLPRALNGEVTSLMETAGHFIPNTTHTI